MRIRPIETRYMGYRFRSRLEARWAVFFDALGLVWEYEKEGYDLGRGDYYLPDFWLPQVRMWAEVKGEEFTAEQKRLCGLLAEQTGYDVLLLVGAPDYKAYPVCCSVGVETDCYINRDYLDENRFYTAVGEDADGQRACLQGDPWYVEAVDAARGARFEHGESSASTRMALMR